jgi:hypothetical protein
MKINFYDIVKNTKKKKIKPLYKKASNEEKTFRKMTIVRIKK